MKLFGVLPVSVELLVLLAAITAFAVTLAVWHGLIINDRLAPVMKKLVVSRSDARSAYFNPGQPAEGSARGFMRDAVNRFKLLGSKDAAKATQKLARAGLRGRDPLVAYLFARVVLPALLGGGVALLLFGLGLFKMSDTVKALISVAALGIGVVGPDIYVRNRANRRQQALTKALPDTLDLMVICAEAGLGLDAALSRVASEIGPVAPELADELTFTGIELTFQPDRGKALDNLGERTDLPAIRAVVNAVRQTERYGTPLAQSMRVLAAEFRGARMMRAETKAARLPVILTVPMMIFILPPLFVVILGPAILQVIDGLSRF